MLQRDLLDFSKPRKNRVRTAQVPKETGCLCIQNENWMKLIDHLFIKREQYLNLVVQAFEFSSYKGSNEDYRLRHQT